MCVMSEFELGSIAQRAIHDSLYAMIATTLS